MNLNKLNFSLKRKYDEISTKCESYDESVDIYLSNEEKYVLDNSFPKDSLATLTDIEKCKLYQLMKWLSSKLDMCDMYGQE